MTTNGNDPLVDLWAEQNRLEALGRAADIDDPEIDQAGDKPSAIQGRIANTEARTHTQHRSRAKPQGGSVTETAGSARRRAA